MVMTTSDGRILISQSHQVDVLNLLRSPLVAATNPPDAGVVMLPFPYLSITFDQPMTVASVQTLVNYSLQTTGGETLTVRQAGLRCCHVPHRAARN